MVITARLMASTTPARWWVGLTRLKRRLYHAFITGPDGAGMMDLNSLVDLPGGPILQFAIGINNSGQVIAIGNIPEPEVYTLFLVGLPWFHREAKEDGGMGLSLGCTWYWSNNVPDAVATIAACSEKLSASNRIFPWIFPKTLL